LLGEDGLVIGLPGGNEVMDDARQFMGGSGAAEMLATASSASRLIVILICDPRPRASVS